MNNSRKEYHQQWREQNKERVRSNAASYYEANKERIKERNRTPEHKAKKKAWREANKEKIKKRRLAYNSMHREENAERVRRYRKRNPELVRARALNAIFLPGQTMKGMYEEQGGRCGLCKEGIILEHRMTHLDHCHETGYVRALLCYYCNLEIGRFKDDPALLRRAADYLEAHAQRIAAILNAHAPENSASS